MGSTVAQPDGWLRAVEVVVFPESLRGSARVIIHGISALPA